MTHRAHLGCLHKYSAGVHTYFAVMLAHMRAIMSAGDSSAHTCALHIGHCGPEHRLRSLATADQRSHAVSKLGVSYDKGAGTTIGT